MGNWKQRLHDLLVGMMFGGKSLPFSMVPLFGAEIATEQIIYICFLLIYGICILFTKVCKILKRKISAYIKQEITKINQEQNRSA